MFIIRNARKGDLEKILEIEKASYPEPWTEEAFACEFSKQAANMNIFLAGEDQETGALAGFVAGNIITDYVHILNIAVAPAFRKRGLAGAFMARVEHEAVKRGLGALTLEVRDKNESALNLYKKMGYEARGRRPKYYENRDDAILMWKKL
jgi:ribosomal-protein-alanine N-acetyltransferase